MIERVLILLTTTPGNIAYFLVLLLSIVGAIQGTWEKRGKPIDAGTKKIILCLVVLAVTILIPLLLQVMDLMGIIIGQGAFHLVEDTCISIGIIWMLNCWLKFENRKVGNLLPIIPTILFIMFALISVVFSSQAIISNAYHHSFIDNSWHILTAIIIAASLFILLVKRRKGYIPAGIIFVLILAGQILYLVTYYPNVDPTGTIRVFQLLAFPFMLALPAIIPENDTTDTQMKVVDEINLVESLLPGRVKNDIYGNVVQPIVDLLETDNGDFDEGLMKIMTRKMDADIGYLIHPEKEESLLLHSGYDLANKKSSPQCFIDNENVILELKPQLKGYAKILEDNKPAFLREEIGVLLGFDDPGGILVAPINNVQHQTQSEAFIFLNPHSKRNWSEQAVDQLEMYCKAIAPFFHFHQEQVNLTNAYKNANQQICDVKEEIKDFHDENPWLAEEDLNTLTLTEMVNKLLKEFEIFKNSIDKGQINNSKDKPEVPPSVLVKYEERFRLLLEEVAQLKEELTTAEQKIKESYQEDRKFREYAPEDERILTFSKGIQNPLTTVVEFTDLLLSESMGILSKKQFNCLYRIKESSLSIHNVLNEIDKLGTKPELDVTLSDFFDLNPLIDQAIMLISVILQERRIALQLDLPPHLPNVKISKDSLQEILNQVFLITSKLCNKNGIIKFLLQIINVDQEDLILLKMNKVGGDTFPSELVQELESREQTPDEDRPESGGLRQRISMVRSLKDELSGKIWVENLAEGGFSISLLLPCKKGEV